MIKNNICVLSFFLLFIITSSRIIVADEVTIHWSGIDGELLENAKKYVNLREENSEKLSAQRIKYLFDIADDEILLSLRPFGYYNAQVDSKLIEPSKQNSSWQVNFSIKLNQPVILQSVNIKLTGEIKQDPEFNQFINNLSLRKGDILNHQLYEKNKRLLQEFAQERGYFDATIKKHQIKVYKTNQQAKIDLHLESGPRYCIDHVSIKQNQFSPELLKQYIPFKDGEPYSRDKLLQLRYALMDSGFFSKLNIQEIKLIDKSKHCIYLLIKPELREKDTYRGRIGFGTDTSIRVGIDAKYNYLNRFGHSLDGSLGFTLEKNRYLARSNYIIPVDQTKDTFLKFSLAYKAEDYTSSDVGANNVDGLTRVEDLSLSLGWHQSRILFNSLKLDEVFRLEYLIESYDLFPLLFTNEYQDLLKTVVNNPDFASDFPDGGLSVLTPDFNVLSLGVNWSYQNADNRIYANRGYRIDWGIKGASKVLGSDVSYWQTRMTTKYIHRLNRTSRLLFRSDMAYTDAEVEDFFGTPINQLPRELLFATGGDNSIRGYEFEELDGGETLPRAKHLLVGSLEYEYEIYPQWSLAAFYDMGNAFNSFSKFDAVTGVGLGIRWHSPVGMIRLDIAHAKDRDGSFRLHFTIGPDF